ncbi:MAG: DUF814 domain-containing protein [Deltaproteobacteria bacterium]|nr:DUF814 domain-containing protein [Deltaproteobacteria bacterium]
MDAIFLSHLIGELRAALIGLRVGKVFQPGPNIWTLDMGRPGHLVLLTAKGQEALFLSPAKMDNPASPPATAMWLRKRISGRVVIDVIGDWPRRRLSLALGGADPVFLILDLGTGTELVHQLPAEFGHLCPWPTLEEFLSMDRVWERYPQITPALRRELRELVHDGQESRAGSLYEAVRNGLADGFWIRRSEGGSPLAWPVRNESGECYDTALDAALAHGLRRTMARVGAEAADRERARLEKRSRARVLNHLERDEARLMTMVGQAGAASLIKGNLHRLDPKTRTAEIEVSGPDGESVHIVLDPALTVQENMARMFARAAKGRRGLPKVAERRLAVSSGQAEVSVPIPQSRKADRPRGRTQVQPDRYARAQVRTYRSSDGFLILRGKNKAANHRLLSFLCSPFDLWFHVEGGPGAHVILRRDHPNHEVPETSLNQAAALAGIFSHQSGSDRARVICALVRDVRKIKGADLGHVAVDRVLYSLVVPLDPDLETRLNFGGAPEQ